MMLKIGGILLLCIVLLTFSVVGYAKEDSASPHKVYQMPPHKIRDYIKSTKGQKRAIVIYASWCPSCVRKMPDIMDLERAAKGSIIAISVDDDHRHFARYIKKFDDIPFKVLLNDGSEWGLAKNLKQFGVKPWNSIPQIILLDENNEAVSQGNYKIDYVSEFLFGKKEAE